MSYGYNLGRFYLSISTRRNRLWWELSSNDYHHIFLNGYAPDELHALKTALSQIPVIDRMVHDEAAKEGAK